MFKVIKVSQSQALGSEGQIVNMSKHYILFLALIIQIMDNIFLEKEKYQKLNILEIVT